jgi:hypothetical protein
MPTSRPLCSMFRSLHKMFICSMRAPCPAHPAASGDLIVNRARRPPLQEAPVFDRAGDSLECRAPSGHSSLPWYQPQLSDLSRCPSSRGVLSEPTAPGSRPVLDVSPAFPNSATGDGILCRLIRLVPPIESCPLPSKSADSSCCQLTKSIPTWGDPPPSLHGHYSVSSVLRGSPPLTGALVLSASRGYHLRLSLFIARQAR